MFLTGFEPTTYRAGIPRSTYYAIALYEFSVPPTYTGYTVLHSPHYIAEVTFENVEPKEFVF